MYLQNESLDSPDFVPLVYTEVEYFFCLGHTHAAVHADLVGSNNTEFLCIG